MKKVTSRPVEPEMLSIDQKTTLGLTLWLLLAVYFTLNYITFTYYPKNLLSLESPGFWLLHLNNVFIASIVIFNKRAIGWKWEDLGLGRPVNWWKPILYVLGVMGVLVLFARYVQPEIIASFGPHTNISHLYALKGNLPLLIWMIFNVWLMAAFLQEIVFRAFLINALDNLMGKTIWSLWISVLASVIIFAGIHAYQGISGLLITGFVGLVFGLVYIFNGRRIWPIVFVHGLADTMTMVSIYNM